MQKIFTKTILALSSLGLVGSTFIGPSALAQADGLDKGICLSARGKVDCQSLNKENPPTQIITEKIPEPFVKKLDDFRNQIGKDVYTNDVVIPSESEKYYWEVETTQLGPKETDEYLRANRLNDPELIIVKAVMTVVRLKAKDGYELSKDQRREWCFIVDTIARDPSFDLERPFDPGPTNNEPIHADVLAKNGICEVGVDPNAPIDQKLGSQIIAAFRSKPDANGKVNRFFITLPEIKAVNAYGNNPNWTPDGELFIGGKEPRIIPKFLPYARFFGNRDQRNSLILTVEMTTDYDLTSPHYLVSPKEYYTKTPPGYKTPIKDRYTVPYTEGPMYARVSYDFDYLDDYENCFDPKSKPSTKPSETATPSPSVKPSENGQKSYHCESATGVKDCNAYYPDSLKTKTITEPIPSPQLNTSLDAVKDLDDKGEYKNEVVVPKDGEGYYFNVKDYEIDPKALEFKSNSHKDVYEGVETKEARVVKVTLKTRSGFELPASQRREWCFVTEKFKKTPPPPEPTPEAPKTTPEVTPEPTPEAPKTTPEVTPEPTPEAPKTTPEVTPEPTPEAPKTTPEVTPEPTPEAPKTTPEVTPEPTPEAPKTTPEVTPEPTPEAPKTEVAPTPDPEVTPSVTPSTTVSPSQPSNPSSPMVKKRGLPTTGAAGGVGLFALSAISGAALVLRLRRKE